MSEIHVLVVDDEKEIADVIELYLKNDQYNVLKFYTGQEALDCIASTKIDLAILDIMLPEEDGLSILKKIRIRPDVRKLPVIMLTAKGSEFDTVVGLDSGADDYIPKPFRMMELISRVRALLRRAEDNGAEEYRMENLYVCPGRHEVTVDQEPVNLTLKEYEMLCLLLKNSGTVLSRTQLLNQIWGYEYIGDTRTVDVHIKRIREKIKDHAHWAIDTVWGIGYKFVTK